LGLSVSAGWTPSRRIPRPDALGAAAKGLGLRIRHGLERVVDEDVAHRDALVPAPRQWDSKWRGVRGLPSQLIEQRRRPHPCRGASVGCARSARRAAQGRRRRARRPGAGEHAGPAGERAGPARRRRARRPGRRARGPARRRRARRPAMMRHTIHRWTAKAPAPGAEWQLNVRRRARSVRFAYGSLPIASARPRSGRWTDDAGSRRPGSHAGNQGAARRASPRTAASPRAAASPRTAASPREAASPRTAASPRAAASPREAALPRAAASPRAAVSPSVRVRMITAGARIDREGPGATGRVGRVAPA
jgi:hypothetical protein